MNHHQWCLRSPKDLLPDGTCKSCQHLYLAYPPQGNLYYDAPGEWYFPAANVSISECA